MPVSLEQIKSRHAIPWIDVACQTWELDGKTPETSVRLYRLRAGDRLTLGNLAAELPRDPDTGKIAGEQGFEFAVKLLSKSIVDENNSRTFDCDEGRELLLSDIDAVQELAPHAIRLNGLGPGDEEHEREAAKKK